MTAGKDKSDRSSPWSVALQCLGYCRCQFFCSIVIQQLDQVGALATDRLTALESRREKLLDLWNCMNQPGYGGGSQRFSFLLDNGGYVSRIVDLLMPII